MIEQLELSVLLVFLILVFVLLRWNYSRARRILEHWAQNNGYEILSSERRVFRKGPFFWTANNGQEVYFVMIRTSEGKTQRGWVCCGSWFWGTFVDTTKVRWEE